MIYDVETALSDRSKCNKCNRQIAKNEVRLMRLCNVYSHYEKYFFCKKCGTKILLDEIDDLDKMRRKLK